MKAPTSDYAIFNLAGQPQEAIAYGLTKARPIAILDRRSGRIVWRGKTAHGARNAHYRLSLERITGKPVSAAQARRAGNA